MSARHHARSPLASSVPLNDGRIFAEFRDHDGPWSYDGHLVEHGGMDIALSSSGGEAIFAIFEGTVEHSLLDPGSGSPQSGFGEAVVIKTSDTHVLYAHMQQGSRQVEVGDSVEPGAYLGRVGNTGAATGPHLHIQVNRGPITTGKNGALITWPFYDEATRARCSTTYPRTESYYYAELRGLRDPRDIGISGISRIPDSQDPLPTAHHVQQGDTLRKLAERFYGDSGLWPRLLEANRQTLFPVLLFRVDVADVDLWGPLRSPTLLIPPRSQLPLAPALPESRPPDMPGTTTTPGTGTTPGSGTTPGAGTTPGTGTTPGAGTTSAADWIEWFEWVRTAIAAGTPRWILEGMLKDFENHTGGQFPAHLLPADFAREGSINLSPPSPPLSAPVAKADSGDLGLGSYEIVEEVPDISQINAVPLGAQIVTSSNEVYTNYGLPDGALSALPPDQYALVPDWVKGEGALQVPAPPVDTSGVGLGYVLAGLDQLAANGQIDLAVRDSYGYEY